jgi:hypothetical protein
MTRAKSGFVSSWIFNYKAAFIWWISLFTAFGPVYWLIFDTTYNSTFFPNNPFAYSMFQGLFIASFTTGIMKLAYMVMTRRGIVS